MLEKERQLNLQLMKELSLIYSRNKVDTLPATIPSDEERSRSIRNAESYFREKESEAGSQSLSYRCAPDIPLGPHSNLTGQHCRESELQGEFISQTSYRYSENFNSNILNKKEEPKLGRT